MNEFFGNGCWKSFSHVVRFRSKCASVNLIDTKNDCAERERKGSSTILDIGDSEHEDLLGDKTLGRETICHEHANSLLRLVRFAKRFTT